MRKNILIIINLILIVIPIFVTYYLIEFYREKINDKAINQETLGQIGDYFGGLLNPLISYCAFVVIILTLLVNYISFKNAIKDSANIQVRHIEELSQSNAINLLLVFKGTVDKARSQNDIDSNFNPFKELLKLLVYSYESLTEEQIVKIKNYTSQIDIQWGISSRYISLLSELNTSVNPFQKMIFDGALALLDQHEIEKILYCLAAMNKIDLARNIASSSSIKGVINNNLLENIEIISKVASPR